MERIYDLVTDMRTRLGRSAKNVVGYGHLGKLEHTYIEWLFFAFIDLNVIIVRGDYSEAVKR